MGTKIHCFTTQQTFFRLCRHQLLHFLLQKEKQYLSHTSLFANSGKVILSQDSGFFAALLLLKDFSPLGIAGAFKTLLKHCGHHRRLAVEIQPLIKRKKN